MFAGATNVTVAFASPAVATIEVGASGTTAFEVYVKAEGLVSEPLLVGVNTILPATVVFIVNDCEAEEFEKDRTFADNPILPDPDGVIVIVPV